MSALAKSPEVLPAWEAWTDIEALDVLKIYSKTDLADRWKVNRRTVYRWHTLALQHAPGYSEGFRSVLHQAHCPECNEVYDLSFLQYKSAKRKIPV